MNLGEIITLLIALYGAFLSTYIFYINRKDKQRNVIVELSVGFLVGQGGTSSDSMLLVNAVNPGERDVLINTPGLLLPDQKTIVWPIPLSDVSFPHNLKEGENCKVWSPLNELAIELSRSGYNGSIKLRGFCDDRVGTRHIGKSFDFNIDEKLKIK